MSQQRTENLLDNLFFDFFDRLMKKHSIDEWTKGTIYQEASDAMNIAIKIRDKSI
jgi:hypothetical protein